MSQSQMMVLNDSTVSRMMADKAVHDQVFRDQLLDCAASPDFAARNTRTKNKKYQAVLQAIVKCRTQIADQAGLKAPDWFNGEPQDLSTYLKKTTNPRALMVKANAQEDKETAAPSVKADCEWGWVGIPICIVHLARAFLQSTLRFQADPTPFPFERLPIELRLQVYREALTGAVCDGVACAKLIVVTPRRRKDNKAYFGCVDLDKGESKEITVGILATSQLINREAIPVLYELRTFDFGTNVKGISSFLSSLSEQARHNVHGICMELHDKSEPGCCSPGVRNGQDNRAAWRKACTYIAGNVNVKQLSITINVKICANSRTCTWVTDLVKIRSLKSLTLRVNQHYNTGPVRPRASYKEGSLSAADCCFSEHLVPFFEYLREEMLE